MDQIFDGKLAERAIPPPMKIVENGGIFKNDRKSRISRSISPYKMKYFFDKEILVVGESNELLDKKWSPNFVMTCSNIVYIIMCGNSKDVFWSKMKAKIGMTIVIECFEVHVNCARKVQGEN
ncbi:hypothetical protein PFBG_01950 [Plasmodium falciparum 7G8]|uniref:Uncharacterized protein n=1 Tax=Plasmodium falciparum (isolate 7G8) TaxID=57266 RepID=W7FA00_PLAF8|nr:hypothetical protein PFBG_01950 [Plasmodium falciparum 7G8]